MPDRDLASMALIGIDRDVYPPSEDSFLLADALARVWRSRLAASPPALVVELGTGSGYVACSNALLARACGAEKITKTRASDVNARACACAEVTFAAHGVSRDAYDVSLGDLFTPHADAIALNGGIDVLLFNPPYVVTPSAEVGAVGIEASWAGGVRGREVLDRALGSVARVLAPGGIFLCVLIAQNDPQSVMDALRRDGLSCEVFSAMKADEEELCVIKCEKAR